MPIAIKNEMEYTKGKFNDGHTGWKVVSSKNTGSYKTNEIHYSDTGECIAEIVHTEADAKLIEMAPTMYEALKEIAEGKGRYNPDRLQHAENTIDDMMKLAQDAIKPCVYLNQPQ